MMKILIVAVGALKESYWREAQVEYLKRLGVFAKVSIIEVNDVPFKNISDKDRVLRMEGESIKKSIPDGAYVIALDREGKSYTSEQFAGFIADESSSGRTIAFIIGGALGLTPDVPVHARISLSDLTYPHQIARILLLEQLYRTMTIVNGKTYHY